MDWQWLLMTGLSTGGILGYLLKSYIDSRSKEREWRKKYYYEDLQRQRQLLQEFLGQIGVNPFCWTG